MSDAYTDFSHFSSLALHSVLYISSKCRSGIIYFRVPYSIKTELFGRHRCNEFIPTSNLQQLAEVNLTEFKPRIHTSLPSMNTTKTDAKKLHDASKITPREHVTNNVDIN